MGAALVVFVVLASIGTATRGIIAEEIQPYLRRHTLVLEAPDCDEVAPTPPYEKVGSPPPRLFSTSSWPIVAYDGTSRMWPVLIRELLIRHRQLPRHRDGAAPRRRRRGGAPEHRILLGLLIVALTFVLARRTGGEHAALATALVATSFG